MGSAWLVTTVLRRIIIIINIIMVVQDNKELISAVEDNVGDAVVDSNGNHGEERVSASENSSSNSEHSDEEPEENDLIRLKELIPTVSAKDNVTQLDIILEAIRYIDSLQNKLADKIDNGEIELVKVNQ